MHMFYTKVSVFSLDVFLALSGRGCRCNWDIYDIYYIMNCIIIVNSKCRWALRDDGIRDPGQCVTAAVPGDIIFPHCTFPRCGRGTVNQLILISKCEAASKHIKQSPG